MCRVPQESPQAIQDLMFQCLDRRPEARPTAGEVVALLEQPPAELPPALRHRPDCRPPADAPVSSVFCL